MSKIEIMSEDLANKIAAGEVVEKTMNVVKELVENSIDAKSKCIKIELIDSGIKNITITDDGIGMDKIDAINCFSRHATSKLHNINDLFNINSLGFRGEALPSIASVSKINLKTSNGIVGTNIIIHGGKLILNAPSDIRVGTKIEVSDLFYNTPVRLKYLKSLYSELANITEYINKMALSYPNIKFTLINNEKTLLETNGSGNLLKVINSIYGLETTKKMVEIQNNNDDYEIIGYLSYPEVARTNRNNITILVNNRVIKNNEIIKTIVESYHTYIPENRYPVMILNIKSDPFLVDVNVHPTKMDVKFSNIEDLKQLITETILKKLREILLIPELKINTDNVLEEIKKNTVNSDYIEQLNFNYQINDNNELYLENKTKLEEKENNKEKYHNNYDKDGNTINKNEVKILPIKPIGSVHGTYIIGENEIGMYIIDQHAAHERINYEKTYEAITLHSKNTIDLLIPINIELKNSEFIILNKHLDILKNLNITYEIFGENTLLIRSIPTWINETNAHEAILKIIEIIISTEDFSQRKLYDRISMTMACKMSIKANDARTLSDMEYLLNELVKTNNPYTCPHGRPTIIKYTKQDLEKSFKRSIES